MPNTPLQRFRAVEPANWGFGSSATLASQPFVLTHCATLTVGTGSIQTNTPITFSASTNDANRFLPWLSRSFDSALTTGSYFPVKVPNAYDRIYIFPMFMISVNDTQAQADLATLSSSSYVGPWAIPMGLAPETRGFSTVNRNNPSQMYLPEDLLNSTGLTSQVGNSGFSTRTHGIWTPLPAYGTNFTTSNGLMAVGTSTNPVSYGRNTGTSVGVGTSYAFPDDLTISKANANPISDTNSQLAGNNAGLIGMGQEFQTMGSEEIVLCLGAPPTGITATLPIASGKNFLTHWFMMGMFLG